MSTATVRTTVGQLATGQPEAGQNTITIRGRAYSDYTLETGVWLVELKYRLFAADQPLVIDQK